MEWGLFGTKTKATIIWRVWRQRIFIQRLFYLSFSVFLLVSRCSSRPETERTPRICSLYMYCLFDRDLLVSAVRNQRHRFCVYFWSFFLSCTQLLNETVLSLSLRPELSLTIAPAIINTHADDFHLGILLLLPLILKYVLSRGALLSSGR